MIERFNKDNQPNNVWWITKSFKLPENMEFIQDEKKSDHYFLTVTEKISSKQLHDNLLWLADHMSIIKDASRS